MPSHVMEITRIVTEAVLSAQEENRRKGVPNVYVLNGKLVCRTERFCRIRHDLQTVWQPRIRRGWDEESVVCYTICLFSFAACSVSAWRREENFVLRQPRQAGR